MSPKPSVNTVPIEIAPGELLDKISILQIKMERIQDATKVANVQTELILMEDAKQAHLPNTPQLDDFLAQLKTVNEALWEIEDDIRDCEREQQFSDPLYTAGESRVSNQ